MVALHSCGEEGVLLEGRQIAVQYSEQLHSLSNFRSVKMFIKV